MYIPNKAEIIFKALADDERATLPFVDTNIVANLVDRVWPHIAGNVDLLELAAQIQTICAKAGA
jgi:hypothetical protein